MLGSFDNLNILSVNAKAIFEMVTDDTITAHLNKKYNSSSFDFMEIQTSVVNMQRHSFGGFSSYVTASSSGSEGPTDGAVSPSQSPIGLRNLKLVKKGKDSSSLSLGPSRNDLLIAFDVAVSIRTTTLFNQKRLEIEVSNAFNTEKKRTKYIFDLQEYEREEVSFNAINRAAIMIDGEQVIAPPSTSPYVEKKTWRTFYGPIIIASVVFLLLCILCFSWRRNQKADTAVPNVPNEQVSSKMSFDEDIFDESVTSTVYNNNMRSTIDLVDNEDQCVSTLGNSQHKHDPLYSTLEYGEDVPEDELQFTKLNNLVASSDESRELSQITPDHTDDDSSIEDERIEVIAQADTLGLAIDTPMGGGPIVHAIKNTSVLMNQVNLRDKLVSVDGVDTTKMTSYDVSRLILSKGKKQCILVFARSETQDPDQCI